MPLYLEELTKLVVEEGSRSSDNPPSRPAGPDAVPIPASLADSLAARLDRLADAKRVAQLGAAIGRQFSAELLTEVVKAVESVSTEALPGNVDRSRRGGAAAGRARPPWRHRVHVQARPHPGRRLRVAAAGDAAAVPRADRPDTGRPLPEHGRNRTRTAGAPLPRGGDDRRVGAALAGGWQAGPACLGQPGGDRPPQRAAWTCSWPCLPGRRGPGRSWSSASRSGPPTWPFAATPRPWWRPATGGRGSCAGSSATPRSSCRSCTACGPTTSCGPSTSARWRWAGRCSGSASRPATTAPSSRATCRPGGRTSSSASSTTPAGTSSAPSSSTTTTGTPRTPSPTRTTRRCRCAATSPRCCGWRATPTSRCGAARRTSPCCVRSPPIPYSVAFGLTLAAVVRQYRGDRRATRTLVDQALDLCEAQGLAFLAAMATILDGWVIADDGDVVRGTRPDARRPGRPARHRRRAGQALPGSA